MCSCLSDLQVTEHDFGAVMTRRAHHSASGMCAGSAEVQPVERRAMSVVPECGSRICELVEGQRSVHNVAAMQAKRPLEIEGADNIPEQNRRTETGTELFDDAEDTIAERVLKRRIGPTAHFRVQIVRSELNKELHIQTHRGRETDTRHCTHRHSIHTTAAAIDPSRRYVP
jgi:hypothetical protein